jgi:hypothetical protein
MIKLKKRKLCLVRQSSQDKLNLLKVLNKIIKKTIYKILKIREVVVKREK